MDSQPVLSPASFPSKSEDWWIAEEHEVDRLWKEPEVIIYNNATRPGLSNTAKAYDIANRRWYHLKIDSDSARGFEDWMVDLIEKCIKDYHSQHGTLPDFNFIQTNREISYLSFLKDPYRFIARSIQHNFHYGGRPKDTLPTTTFDEVKQKIHLSCSADRCVWKGLDCVFKRVEFSEDIDAIEREIRTREALEVARKESADPHASIQDRFCVLPVLAVVHKHSATDEVLGILLPYGGTCLETLAGGREYGMSLEPKDERPPRPWPTLPITEPQIHELVRAVSELSRAGVLLGDIVDRNTLLTPDGRLVLIDFGGVAPEYKTDAHALGNMILWILERVGWEDERGIERVRLVGESLRDSESFDSLPQPVSAGSSFSKVDHSDQAT